MAVGAVLLALLSVRYLTLNPDVYFPRQRAVYEAHTVALVAHVGAMLFAALLGPLQFLPGLRRRWPRFHRVSGRLYVAGALIGAVAGLEMARRAATGWPTGLGFALLAVGVLLTTVLAFVAIKRRRIAAHRAWMIRGYALIFAAVTLRLYLPFLAAALGEDGGYIAVAWLSWLPNLVVAEWLLRRSRRPSPASVSAPRERVAA